MSERKFTHRTPTDPEVFGPSCLVSESRTESVTESVGAPTLASIARPLAYVLARSAVAVVVPDIAWLKTRPPPHCFRLLEPKKTSGTRAMAPVVTIGSLFCQKRCRVAVFLWPIKAADASAC